MDASAVDFMRHLIENVDRKHDAMSDLRDKVALLTMEKRIMEAEAGRQAAEHQLAVKDAEIQRLLRVSPSSTTAERDASEQREVAGAAVPDMRETTRLKEVIARACSLLVFVLSR